MTDEQKIQKFTQDVYMTRYNRLVDGIPTNWETEVAVTDTDALAEIYKTIAWANMWLDEIEMETDNDGMPINWNFMRENNVELATISSASQVVELDDDILRLVTDQNRPLKIVSDGAVIATFDVVDASRITSRRDQSTSDSVTVLNNTLIFSRAFTDGELTATIVADVITSIPRLTTTDATAIDTVKPYKLMVLGTAKDATLPDIIAGGLSPSFVQRYADLLTNAKASNDVSSTADELVKEDYGSVGGIY